MGEGEGEREAEGKADMDLYDALRELGFNDSQYVQKRAKQAMVSVLVVDARHVPRSAPRFSPTARPSGSSGARCLCRTWSTSRGVAAEKLMHAVGSHKQIIHQVSHEVSEEEGRPAR